MAHRAGLDFLPRKKSGSRKRVGFEDPPVLFEDERVRDSASDFGRENGSEAATSDRGIRDESSIARSGYGTARSVHWDDYSYPPGISPPPQVFPPSAYAPSHPYARRIPPPPGYLSQQGVPQEAAMWREPPVPRTAIQSPVQNEITARSQAASERRAVDKLITWLDSFATRERMPRIRTRQTLLRHLLEEGYGQLFRVFPKNLPRAIEEHLESRTKHAVKEIRAEQKRWDPSTAGEVALDLDLEIVPWQDTLLPALIKQIRRQAQKLSELEGSGSKGSEKHQNVDAGTQTELSGDIVST